MGMVAGYLPWLMYLNRTVFQFYTIAFEPYLILGLTLVIGLLITSASGRVVVVVFLALAVLVSAFYFPLWTGAQVPFGFWQAHIWLPSWR